MTPTLLILIGIAAVATGVALFAVIALVRRREVLDRATTDSESSGISVLRKAEARRGAFTDLVERVGERAKDNSATSQKLVQAGYDTPSAPAYYFFLRISALVVFPLVALLLFPRTNFVVYVLGLVVALYFGMILPMALLDRFVRLRQERIRRSVPDALDLLVVCVEAGVSLDAAILRVSREVRLAHRELAYELSVVNRLTNAGMPREEALRQLWQRTGVEDLRALVSSLIQSEKWGTSVATVLRVSAETLRRKRRQAAEKKAKMAPLKMTFPLLFFILPALFVVILGPAVVQVINEFGKV